MREGKVLFSLPWRILEEYTRKGFKFLIYVCEKDDHFGNMKEKGITVLAERFRTFPAAGGRHRALSIQSKFPRFPVRNPMEREKFRKEFPKI